MCGEKCTLAQGISEYPFKSITLIKCIVTICVHVRAYQIARAKIIYCINKFIDISMNYLCIVYHYALSSFSIIDNRPTTIYSKERK